MVMEIVQKTDPEIEMDKAMYGMIKVYTVHVKVNQYFTLKQADIEIKEAMGRLVGEGYPAECDSIVNEENKSLTGTVRIFKDIEGLKRWQADEPLRIIEQKAKSGRW
jgi:hypothetical protein